MKKYILLLAILLIGVVIGWLCRGDHFREEVKMVQTDTLIVRDTIRESYPIPMREEIVRWEYVVVRDTVRVKDTLYLSLPHSKMFYATDEYYAEVSGYNPSLDYIEVYPRTMVVKERVKIDDPKNNIGIGIEANYLNAASIPIYLEYGRMLHKNVEIYGQIAYDLPTRQWGVGAGIKAQLEW